MNLRKYMESDERHDPRKQTLERHYRNGPFGPQFSANRRHSCHTWRIKQAENHHRHGVSHSKNIPYAQKLHSGNDAFLSHKAGKK